MTSIPIYLAIARTGGAEQAGTDYGSVVVTGTHEKTAALEATAVPLPAGLLRWQARKAIAAVLHDHGWRVAGMWDDRSRDVTWSVTVERIVTCAFCGTEIWWRIPLRLAGRPGVLGGWCDTDLDDFCDVRGKGGGPHEPRKLAGERTADSAGDAGTGPGASSREPRAAALVLLERMREVRGHIEDMPDGERVWILGALAGALESALDPEAQ
jgi:hypothetical protein